MVKAAEQFIIDCGNDTTVIDVAKTMLIESRTITIDDSITWTLLPMGMCTRTTANTYQYYYSNGGIARAFRPSFIS